jgi:hypothetical protein
VLEMASGSLVLTTFYTTPTESQIPVTTVWELKRGASFRVRKVLSVQEDSNDCWRPRLASNFTEQ